MKDRIVIINSKSEPPIEMVFDSKRMADSTALHQMLTQFNPGDEYTVRYRNWKEEK